MIKFFRQIRRTLINQNNMGKYLKYAIGEIILVVLGILIALSINNWNENHKLDQKEISVAKEIYSELDENFESITNQLKLWEERNKNLFKISDIIVSENLEVTNRQFDSLMLYVIGYNNFKLKHSKFSKIIASENFEFKRSKQIITDMLTLNADYNTLMAYYEFNDDNAQNILQPYLIKNYSHRNFSSYYKNKYNNGKSDYRTLLSDIEFDNIIQNTIGNNAPFVSNIKKTLKRMENFKQLLEEVYPSIKEIDD